MSYQIYVSWNNKPCIENFVIIDLQNNEVVAHSFCNYSLDSNQDISFKQCEIAVEDYLNLKKVTYFKDKQPCFVYLTPAFVLKSWYDCVCALRAFEHDDLYSLCTLQGRFLKSALLELERILHYGKEISNDENSKSCQ